VPGTTSVVVTVVHGVSTGAVSRCVLASGRIVLIGSIVVAGCALCGHYEADREERKLGRYLRYMAMMWYVQMRAAPSGDPWHLRLI